MSGKGSISRMSDDMSDETGNGVSALHCVSGCYAEVHISWEICCSLYNRFARNNVTSSAFEITFWYARSGESNIHNLCSYPHLFHHPYQDLRNTFQHHEQSVLYQKDRLSKRHYLYRHNDH